MSTEATAVETPLATATPGGGAGGGDNVLRLTPEQAKHRIAELLGIMDISTPGHDFYYVRPTGPERFEFVGIELPDWPGNIAAAWPLYLKMPRPLLWHFSTPTGKRHCCVYDADSGNCEQAECATGEWAICAAWLSWRMGRPVEIHDTSADAGEGRRTDGVER